MKHFLFLYTRMPDYFLQSIRHLLDTCGPGAKAWIVHYDPDEDAPYEHGTEDTRLRFIPKSAFHEPLIDTEIKPALIYITGWGDPQYKAIAAEWKKRVPVVMGLDNPWTGSLKQRIASFLSPWLVKKYCTTMWVTGRPQYTFARKLGFADKQIISGLYCADTKGILPAFSTAIPERRILFVGRMVPYKRPDWLLNAFTEIVQQQQPALSNWKLIMIGNGPMKEELQVRFGSNPAVEFIAFLQPAEAKQQYAAASLFCLPSHHEHWGVVVQEAAAAGLPLLLSDTVAAASTFLENGRNGYVFNSNTYNDFKEKLASLMQESEQRLQQMGSVSRQLSLRITHDTWAMALKTVLVGR